MTQQCTQQTRIVCVCEREITLHDKQEYLITISIVVLLTGFKVSFLHRCEHWSDKTALVFKGARILKLQLLGGWGMLRLQEGNETHNTRHLLHAMGPLILLGCFFSK